MAAKLTTVSAWVVNGGVIIQAIVRFEEAEGPCKVVTSADTYFAPKESIVERFKWAVTLDVAKLYAERFLRKKLATRRERVQACEDALKRCATDQGLADLSMEKQEYAHEVAELRRCLDDTSPNNLANGFTIFKLKQDL